MGASLKLLIRGAATPIKPAQKYRLSWDHNYSKGGDRPPPEAELMSFGVDFPDASDLVASRDLLSLEELSNESSLSMLTSESKGRIWASREPSCYWGLVAHTASFFGLCHQ
jgi:hypothetical protein